MISLACFAGVGLVLGFLMPVWGFAFVSLLAILAYAIFTPGFSGLGRAYDVIFAAVALQVGYFLAVLLHTGLDRYLASSKPEKSAEAANGQPGITETSPAKAGRRSDGVK